MALHSSVAVCFIARIIQQVLFCVYFKSCDRPFESRSLAKNWHEFSNSFWVTEFRVVAKLCRTIFSLLTAPYICFSYCLLIAKIVQCRFFLQNIGIERFSNDWLRFAVLFHLWDAEFKWVWVCQMEARLSSLVNCALPVCWMFECEEQWS